MPAAALWRMGALDRRRAATWRRRAMRATLRLRGAESADTHDAGFVYEAAAYGYDAGCRTAAARAVHATALSRAAEVRALRRRSPGADDPRERSRAAVADPPRALRRLPAGRTRDDRRLDDEHRAARVGATARGPRRLHATGARPRPRCRRCADPRRTAAPRRRSSPTRRAGRLFGVHTHQGISAASTWARGQAWAMLGFARLARDARAPWAVEVARRLAGCWLAKAPRDGVVRFDLDAVSGPPDSSAQAVAAAGLATLARVDRPRAAQWRSAARAQLGPVEKLVSGSAAARPAGRADLCRGRGPVRREHRAADRPAVRARRAGLGSQEVSCDSSSRSASRSARSESSSRRSTATSSARPSG